MKREWMLLLGMTVVTVWVVIGMVRWLAPELLGGPTDLQIVQLDEKMPPFYEGVFRRDDYASREFLLKDPVTRVRPKPLFPDLGGVGPHDILGFRNQAVPNVADILVIGDSQTYGNNARLESNWPNQMKTALPQEDLSVYGMAVGGWGAPQYLAMASKAFAFGPKAIVVAFYSGNDPLESFSLVYGTKVWEWLIPDQSLTAADAPSAQFPAPESEWWKAEFSDGIQTVFTPTLRLTSNLDHPAVAAGWQIMADVAKVVSELAARNQVHVAFTIIPTKELAYRRKVQAEGLVPPEDYQRLVTREAENIETLAGSIQALPHGTYVDVVTPLQESATENLSLYPANINGHPVSAGYAVVGRAVAAALRPSL